MKVLALLVAVLCVAAAETRVYVVHASKSDMGNSIVKHKPVKQEKTSLKIAVSVQSTVENQTAVNKLVSVENQTAVNKLAIAAKSRGHISTHLQVCVLERPAW